MVLAVSTEDRVRQANQAREDLKNSLLQAPSVAQPVFAPITNNPLQVNEGQSLAGTNMLFDGLTGYEQRQNLNSAQARKDEELMYNRNLLQEQNKLAQDKWAVEKEGTMLNRADEARTRAMAEGQLAVKKALESRVTDFSKQAFQDKSANRALYEKHVNDGALTLEINPETGEGTYKAVSPLFEQVAQEANASIKKVDTVGNSDALYASLTQQREASLADDNPNNDISLEQVQSTYDSAIKSLGQAGTFDPNMDASRKGKIEKVNQDWDKQYKAKFGALTADDTKMITEMDALNQEAVQNGGIDPSYATKTFFERNSRLSPKSQDYINKQIVDLTNEVRSQWGKETSTGGRGNLQTTGSKDVPAPEWLDVYLPLAIKNVLAHTNTKGEDWMDGDAYGNNLVKDQFKRDLKIEMEKIASKNQIHKDIVEHKANQAKAVSLTEMQEAIKAGQFNKEGKPVQGEKKYQDFYNFLGNKESSNNYKAENELGYLGKYQFGGMALEDLGYKKNGQWLGKDGINSKAAFLANPELQDKAIKQYTSKQLGYLKSSGALDHIGKTFQGIKVTEKGLLAAAHLVGAGAVNNMLTTGEVPVDANNTKATEYMKNFG